MVYKFVVALDEILERYILWRAKDELDIFGVIDNDE